jgi:SAM-dependent methyltransferase
MSTHKIHARLFGALSAPGASLCESGRLPVGRLTKPLSLEAHRPKDIYQSHKWFARRIGASFRSLLVGSEVADEKAFWKLFNEGKTSRQLTVLDPFVGGGTSVVEAALLGHNAIGLDIDPVACAVTSFESRLAAIPDLRPHLEALKERMAASLAPYYLSTSAQGVAEVLLHAFWVQVVTCVHCHKNSDAHPDRRIAFDRDWKVQWVLAPTGEVLQLPLSQKSVMDPATGRRLPIEAGTTADGVFTCPHCRKPSRLIDLNKHTHTPPKWELFAVETLDPACKAACVPNRMRHIRAATAADLRVFQAAEGALARRTDKRGHIPHIPVCPIPRENRSDDRILKYGYRYYHQLFNARQLLHLSMLAEEIMKLPPSVREAFSIAYSDHLTTNCMLTAYAPAWRRLLPLFTFRAFTHSIRPVEINPWLERTGRGTYPNAVCSIQRASRSFKVLSQVVDSHGKATQPSIQIRQGNAANLTFLARGTVDLILTDPPYFDNIAYSELSHFYLPWLRMLGVVQSASDSFLNKTMATNSRSPKCQRRFQTQLTRCFSEAHRVLKPDGRLLFTFQQKAAGAWEALAVALAKSHFQVIDVFPLLGDGLMSPHKHKGSSSWDAVFVARRRKGKSIATGSTIPTNALTSAFNHADAWRQSLRRRGFTRADFQNLHRACLAAAATMPQPAKAQRGSLLYALERAVTRRPIAALSPTK